MVISASVVAGAQETTGSMLGTVKDSTGAVIPGAKVTVSTPTLVGTKTFTSDRSGAFHFENLPPGEYTITVEAQGFSTLKQQNVLIEVGHIPSIPLTLAVGSEATVVDVDTAPPMIDVTSVTTTTNITSDVVNYVPHGVSYQSVIQFAPAASNEPLMGNTTTNGSGSVSPGNGSNGLAYGYSVAGGADSENSYLVEGQETANLIGGYSHTNVPFDFIDQVTIVTSGIEAEHGGALGGVVNVIMKKGSPKLHGSLFAQFENQAMDATSSSFIRYDPNGSLKAQPTWTGNGDTSCPAHTGCYAGESDAVIQSYQPKKSHYNYFLPGFTLGGPMGAFLPKLMHIPESWNDKLFFFVAFNPELQRVEKTINYSNPTNVASGSPLAALGNVPFSQNTDTFYTTARIDAQVSKKVRVFGSWLYQYQLQHGKLPQSDSTEGYYNEYTANDPSIYAHTLGYSAPNSTWNTGADITITPSLVSTTRFGYYFENYHDNGYPEGGTVYQFQLASNTETDGLGNPLPAAYAQTIGTQNDALNQITFYNSNKAIQLDQTFAFFKAGWAGQHNFRFGYQLNRLSNYISQRYNEPYVQIFAGGDTTAQYQPGGSVGTLNCAPFVALYGGCQGLYGYALLYDSGTGGKAISYNHSIFVQDSWTIGHGITIDAGVRIEKEFLPGEVQATGVPSHPINFGWGDKIAPRLGASWDVFQNGKLKAFGSYGVFNDQMKLNLAISSFGGQYWNNCAYALDAPSTPASITAAYDATGRYCQGNNTATPGNFSGGVTPAGLTFLENENNRLATPTCTTCNPYEEGVAPNLKPYRQHADVLGVDYQLSRNYSLEGRWDRRRLDHVIEDAAIYANGNETFVIINPGQGVDSTFLNFCNFLYAKDANAATDCVSPTGAYPPNNSIPAARSYDGVEVRLQKAYSQHWAGLFSYTYSHFRGNYTGLTNSDLSDGGSGGRNSPNNGRAFDEPYFQSNSLGGSSSGLLPTDRPNKLKGYVYYKLNYLHSLGTTFGIFQTAYQGSPNTSYTSIGYDEDAYFQQIFNRGQWANVTQNINTGAITVGNPHVYRMPWYNQTDFNAEETVKLGGSKEFSFEATFSNILNQHTVTARYEQIDSAYGAGSFYGRPGGINIASGIPFYAAAMHAYNVSNVLNDNGTHLNNVYGPETISNEYGKPLYYQAPRTIRLQAHFTF
jgi:hypothetical protein